MSERLGIPVELYPASDYAGVMQGLISKNLEYAGLGSAGYAGIHVQDPEAFEPLLTTHQIDDSPGYYSLLYLPPDTPSTPPPHLTVNRLSFPAPPPPPSFSLPSLHLPDNLFQPPP